MLFKTSYCKIFSILVDKIRRFRNETQFQPQRAAYAACFKLKLTLDK